MVNVRLGQRLLRIGYRDGEPCFVFGVVSRVTTTTFDVTHASGVDKSLTGTGVFSGWFKQNWLAAIDGEIRRCFRGKAEEMLFGAHRILSGDAPVEDLVRLANRLWRFRRKCIKKLGRNDGKS